MADDSTIEDLPHGTVPADTSSRIVVVELISGVWTSRYLTLAEAGTIPEGVLDAINDALAALAAQDVVIDGQITTINGHLTTVDGHLTTLDGQFVGLSDDIDALSGDVIHSVTIDQADIVTFADWTDTIAPGTAGKIYLVEPEV